MKNFDWIRFALLGGMGVFLVLLIKQWDGFKQERLQKTIASMEEGSLSTPTVSTTSPATEDIPLLTSESTVASPVSSSPDTSQVVTLHNDVLDLTISLEGGDIIQSDLLAFAVSLKDDTPFRILNRSNAHLYIAQSGLIGKNGTDTNTGRPLFSAASNRFELADGADSVTADLQFDQGDVTIIKRFTLKRGEYLTHVSYLIENRSTETWSAGFFGQIKRDDYKPPVDTGIGVSPYLGAAITTPDNRYQKFSFKDMAEETTQISVETGWVAMLQHYFISAWLPDPSQPLTYSLRKLANTNHYLMGFSQPAIEVAPGTTAEINAAFYVGPKNQYRLAEISENLNLTVDYGWLWWAAQPLFWLLQTIHGFVGNWGIAIILLTLTVKAAFFKLSAASYRSMAKMKKLQPMMQSLKERYGTDRQAMSQEMMKLYQREKVNPMGGCLPILVQMPIFIALYWVLLEAVELRHAPFFLWIQDLSAKDPWFILPLLMGASMFLQQKLNPMPPDPMQARIMQMMPIMFTFMFLWFPSGLVLYWTVNNILSIAQQWYISKKLNAI